MYIYKQQQQKIYTLYIFEICFGNCALKLNYFDRYLRRRKKHTNTQFFG